MTDERTVVLKYKKTVDFEDVLVFNRRHLSSVEGVVEPLEDMVDMSDVEQFNNVD